MEYFLSCQEPKNVTVITNCSHRWWWASESWKDSGRKEFLPSSSHQTAATPHGEPWKSSGCENTVSWPPWIVRNFIVKGVELLIRIRVLSGAEIPSIQRSSGLRFWWANCDLLSGWKNLHQVATILHMVRALVLQGFSGGSAGRESTCNVGNLGSIPGLGRSPGERKGYPLQYFDLETSKDRGAW